MAQHHKSFREFKRIKSVSITASRIALSLMLFALSTAFSRSAFSLDALPTHVRYIADCGKWGDFSEPMGIAYDPAHHDIYVADTGNRRICLLTEKGYPEFVFTEYINGMDHVKFMTPIDVAVNSQGDIYVSDTFYDEVIVMDFRGNLKYMINFAATGFKDARPERIAIDKNDDLYVCDTANNAILVFDSTGRFKSSLGKSEGAPSMEQVYGVYPDTARSRVLVTSKGGTAVWIFDNSGKLTGSFGIHDAGHMNFSFPAGIAATANGDIVVADTLRSDVKVFDAAGNFLYHFGGIGVSVDETVFPVDLEIDNAGNLYVLEKAPGLIHVFHMPDVPGVGS